MSKKTKKLKKKLETFPTIVKHPIVRVDWSDHWTGNNQWMEISQLDTEPKNCVSVGIKVFEDKTVVVLAQNMGINQQVSDTVVILKKAIIKETPLGDIQYGIKN